MIDLDVRFAAPVAAPAAASRRLMQAPRVPRFIGDERQRVSDDAGIYYETRLR